jgi:two-component system, response regulator
MTDKNIVLVEDNADDEELTCRALKEGNVSNPVVVLRDGAEALDYFFGTGAHAGRDLAKMPMLTLLDLNIPKIDGLEVLRRLRSDPRTKRVPIIMMTTSREQEEVFKAYETGCNSYLRKPVDSLEFHEAVKQLGLYWMIYNVPPPQSL